MSGNFQRFGDLAAVEEHDFGEVWRTFLAGRPVADFDDAMTAEDFVRRIISNKKSGGIGFDSVEESI
jgi:hypothetical protein